MFSNNKQTDEQIGFEIELDKDYKWFKIKIMTYIASIVLNLTLGILFASNLMPIAGFLAVLVTISLFWIGAAINHLYIRNEYIKKPLDNITEAQLDLSELNDEIAVSHLAHCQELLHRTQEAVNQFDKAHISSLNKQLQILYEGSRCIAKQDNSGQARDLLAIHREEFISRLENGIEELEEMIADYENGREHLLYAQDIKTIVRESSDSFPEAMDKKTTAANKKRSHQKTKPNLTAKCAIRFYSQNLIEDKKKFSKEYQIEAEKNPKARC